MDFLQNLTTYRYIYSTLSTWTRIFSKMATPLMKKAFSNWGLIYKYFWPSPVEWDVGKKKLRSNNFSHRLLPWCLGTGIVIIYISNWCTSIVFFTLCRYWTDRSYNFGLWNLVYFGSYEKDWSNHFGNDSSRTYFYGSHALNSNGDENIHGKGGHYESAKQLLNHGSGEN